MMICPICKQEIDSDDYWYGDRCLRCALKEELEAGRELGGCDISKEYVKMALDRLEKDRLERSQMEMVL